MRTRFLITIQSMTWDEKKSSSWSTLEKLELSGNPGGVNSLFNAKLDELMDKMSDIQRIIIEKL